MRISSIYFVLYVAFFSICSSQDPIGANGVIAFARNDPATCPDDGNDLEYKITVPNESPDINGRFYFCMNIAASSQPPFANNVQYLLGCIRYLNGVWHAAPYRCTAGSGPNNPNCRDEGRHIVVAEGEVITALISAEDLNQRRTIRVSVDASPQRAMAESSEISYATDGERQDTIYAWSSSYQVTNCEDAISSPVTFEYVSGRNCELGRNSLSKLERVCGVRVSQLGTENTDVSIQFNAPTVPDVSQTISPSTAPSRTPSATPSRTPSTTPSKSPSKTPSTTPSRSPSKTPSTTPSTTPSRSPSRSPMAPSPVQCPDGCVADNASTVPTTVPMYVHTIELMLILSLIINFSFVCYNNCGSTKKKEKYSKTVESVSSDDEDQKFI